VTTNTIIHKAGTEVVSVCTKCKMPLVHIIVAMDELKIKKVRCTTCGKEHRFVSPNIKKRTSTPKVRVEESWKQLMDSSSSKKRIPYTLSGLYRENDVIDHHTFGLGVVNQVLSKEKIRVVFKEGEKFLASARLAL
jgi:uncharacterized Zn finger protein (UPF0148 family)